MKNTVKISFAKCPIPNRREIFRQANCIIPISVGQNLKVHEGEKFSSTIKLVNLSFRSGTLLIDDTIQRHTMRIFSKKSEEEMISQTLTEGDLWLERNLNAYSSLTIDYKIMRWSEWLMHPLFMTKLVQVS